MENIEIRYMSLTGNTEAFLKLLEKESDVPINKVKINEDSIPFQEEKPFFAMVPTYLSGGDGTGDNVIEEFTYPLNEHIAFGTNSSLLLGIIGSGNLNFNEQFALTGIRYSEEFNSPLIFTYELRGNERDAKELSKIMKEVMLEYGK